VVRRARQRASRGWVKEGERERRGGQVKIEWEWRRGEV
jgi:hypothetical protein